MSAQSPCDWFDHDGDGVIGGNTFLYALGNYGVVGGKDILLFLTLL